MNYTESKFSHLLQPILDLTKNWDVDLAAQLGEYLEELDQMIISFDGGRTVMNFAEAALLIQGSTCIFGRKVELLHSLVCQTLDCISNKKQRTFTLIPYQGQLQEHVVSARFFRLHNIYHLLLLASRNSTTEFLLVFMPDQDSDFTKFQVTRCDKQASRDGATDSTSDSDGDYCEFDAVGVEPSIHLVEMKSDPTEPVRIIQLPPESLISADALEKQDFPLLSFKGEVLGSYKDFHISNFMLDALGIICQDEGSSETPILRDTPVIHQEGRTDDIVGKAGVYCENNNSSHSAEEILPLMDNDMDVEQLPEEHVERQQVEAPSERRMLRERPAVQSVPEEPKRLQEAVNPWKWHNAYENTGEDEPLKTGKCYNVPAGLEESGKRKRKGPSKLQDFQFWCTSAYGNKDRKLKNGPFYPEFNYIYLSKMGQRLKVRKKVLRKTGVYVSDEVLKKTYLEPEQQAAQDELFRHGEVDDGEFSDNENENLVDHEPGDINAEHIPVFTDSQIGRISYEDLVKKSVELFLANSQKYIQETALSRRVKDWENEINPRLRAQEECLVFDIHYYGDKIVNLLGTVGTKRSFASLVEGVENTEACRYMLASLQLANDYTVEIGRKEGLEESIDTMDLTLLTKHRVHEQLRNYSHATEQDQL